LRKALSQQLKDAGYKVPVTGEYSALVREKFLEANRDLSEEITTLSANDPKRLESVPYDLTTYLKDRKTDISKIQDGGPTTSRSTNIFTDAEAIAEVQKLYRTLLNAEPTPAEQARLAKRLQNAQKKNPTVTKYRTIGGVQDAITTGGLDPQEFLTNEIKKDPRYNEKQQEKLTTSRATLAATARANGLDLDKNFGSQVDDFLDRIKNGEDIKNIQNLIRQQGRLFLPESVRSAIDSSIDLSSALGIYVNDYAKSRGIPVDQIDINEVIPLAINDKGFASISDFRKAKKKQAWWADTPEADQEVFQGIRQVFSNFGIMEI
jgi:antitoxin component of RelBE/YafQ-DinJ toxin-antitoxin module